MRVVVQRVTRAQVTVAGEVVGRVGRGLLVLVGAGQGDGPADVDYLVEKVCNLRIFEDDAAPAAPTVTATDAVGPIPDSRGERAVGGSLGGPCPSRGGGQSPRSKMNRALLDTGGSLLVVSQFTLHGDCRRGRRPSFTAALEPGAAAALCDRFVQQARAFGVTVATGRFGAIMEVELCNDGPVTLLLDSRKAF